MLGRRFVFGLRCGHSTLSRFATQRFSNYKDYVIATSVHALEGKPFEASFVIISRKTAGGGEEVVHAQRLERTFAYSGDARAWADQAARAYVDNRTSPAH